MILFLPQFLQCVKSSCHSLLPGCIGSPAECVVNGIFPHRRTASGIAPVISGLGALRKLCIFTTSIQYNHMSVYLKVLVSFMGLLPFAPGKTKTPGLFVFEFRLPALCSLRVSLHSARTDASHGQVSILRVLHLMGIADDLITAHLADAHRGTQIHHAHTVPAGVGYILPFPQIGAVRLRPSGTAVSRVFRFCP